jgi:hypothetical protein
VGLFRRFSRGRRKLGSAVLDLPVAPPPSLPFATPTLPLPVPPPPRVELGFRDGSTAALAPDSPQARALRAVADLLATRD